MIYVLLILETYLTDDSGTMLYTENGITYIFSTSFLGLFDTTDVIDEFVAIHGPSESIKEKFKNLSWTSKDSYLMKTVTENKVCSILYAVEVARNRGIFVILNPEVDEFFQKGENIPTTHKLPL